jgi:thioesterase domain-containing protein/acyl carrier protein
MSEPQQPGIRRDRASLSAATRGVNRGLALGGREPPQSDLEARLAAVWRRVLDLPAVGMTQNFFDLGGHSLTGARLVAELQRELGVPMTLATLMRAQTIRAMAAVVEDGTPGGERWQLVTRLRAGERRAALFFVATPNVNALGYASLARRLESGHAVYVLQRRHAREEELGRPYSRAEIEGWAAACLEGVRAVQPAGPYLLVGMCIGAAIAFEMTRRIEAEGGAVALLGMLDTWPDENTRDPFLDRLLTMERRLHAVRRLPRRQQLSWVAGRLGRALLGRSPEERQRAARWRAHNFPGADFRPPQVGCPITVFRAPEQPYWRIDDDALGWRDRTVAGVEVRPIAGDHLGIMREPMVRVLALQLDLHLRALGLD